MQPSENAPKALNGLAGRLADESVRDLFTRFCGEVALFSGSMAMEVTPFEVRFSEPEGFQVHVSPYRDLFRVSIDSANPCDVRVSGEDGYISALDLALKSFLDARAHGTGNPGAGPITGRASVPPSSLP